MTYPASWSKEYPAHLIFAQKDLTLNMLVNITNSVLGNGTVLIPTLLPMSDGKSQRFTIPSTEQERQAVAWNDEVLRKAYGVDYSLADIFSDLGLSKKYISTFVGSILGSGPSADGKEGILLTHGRPSDMTAENNIAKPGELVIFLSGVTECYPQLVCKSGFAKSPQEPQSSSTLLAEYLLMKRLRDK